MTFYYFQKINQISIFLFQLSNSISTDVKILKEPVFLSLRNPCFNVSTDASMNKTGFSKIRFWVLVLVSAVQKLLTLMELREREREI